MVRLLKATIPVFALVTLALLGGYHLMRAAAAACTGGSCDFYIPLSLLVPILILGAAAVCGVLAITAAWREKRWLTILSVSVAISVLGPIIALIALRDSPDAFVITSTILVAVLPVGALIYSFRRLSAT